MEKKNKSILITGVSGTGKSAIYKELVKRGHKAFGLDEIEDLFAMYHKDTHEKVTERIEWTIENAENHKWICDINKLKKLMMDNSEDVVYYCGTGSNINDLIPLFDKVILLTATNDALRHRLTTRTNNDYAKSQEVQEWVFSWKDYWEDSVKEFNPIIVDANKSLDSVVSDIISISEKN
jgi:broad-specificity NMP kinase